MTGEQTQLQDAAQVQAAGLGRVLVAYYSRTGVTRALAEAICRRLGGDLEEIVDTKSRKGAMGFLLACKDAARRKPTEIAPVRKLPQDYDLVVLGTPVWAGTMSPAMRTYLTGHAGQLPRVALFCTQGGAKPGKTFQDMEALCGRAPVATLSLRAKVVKSGQFTAMLDPFVEKLAGA